MNHSSATSRANVISLDITLQPYPAFQKTIIEAARQRKAGMVCFANVHMVVEARRNPEFALAVNSAEWIAADGVPLTWALKGFFGYRQERVAGMDLMPDLLRQAARENIPVFFYGSTPDVLKRATQACYQQFPNLQIAGQLSPPFRALTPDEEDEVVAKITESGARLVFVALGCPKQEQWMARMKHRIPAVLLGIGGALPLLAGEQLRAPLWVRQMGLEWIFRLIQEPKRLLNRYLVTNSLFVYYVFQRALLRRA